jgi:hypothetical protein
VAGDALLAVGEVGGGPREPLFLAGVEVVGGGARAPVGGEDRECEERGGECKAHGDSIVEG